MSIRKSGWVMAAALMAGACAVRLGGPSPQEYTAMALAAGPSESAAEVAQRIRSAAAELVLITAERDSAWFAEVASDVGLALSGPGTTGATALGFLAGLELLGDTSIVLAAGDGRLHMHDALYQIDKNRLLDLMMVSVQPGVDLRETVRTLLSYIATDVGATAALLLAVEAPTAQAADSISVLMRAAFANAYGCAVQTANGSPGPPPGKVRLFYGPSVRMECREARSLDGEVPAIVARLLVGR